MRYATRALPSRAAAIRGERETAAGRRASGSLARARRLLVSGRGGLRLGREPRRPDHEEAAAAREGARPRLLPHLGRHSRRDARLRARHHRAEADREGAGEVRVLSCAAPALLYLARPLLSLPSLAGAVPHL